MTTHRRLSICYAAPGQNLVPWAGPTRNVLSVAEALGQWADVTVVFRTISHLPETNAFRVAAIEPGPAGPGPVNDDNAARGFHPIKHLSYCRTLRSFARKHAGSFDVVLEKGWRLSGLLSAAFRHAGTPAVVVENDVRFWTEPLNSVHQIGKYALHGAAHAVAGECCRRLPGIIAETEELKEMLVTRRRVRPDRIHVIGLGVDHARFRPLEQSTARQELGIRPDALIMLYLGAMDEYHDLEPVIDAMTRSRAPVELHVVGDGEYRARYEAQAKGARLACRFHGPVSQPSVPRYIAAADVCLAPYRTGAFQGRRLTFSTLKIPEYMACARPVVSVPSAGIRRLIADGVSGFIFPNDAASWDGFLAGIPSRDHLASMGEAAARAVQSVTWTSTASQYLKVCESVLSPDPGRTAAPIADSAGLARRANPLR